MRIIKKKRIEDPAAVVSPVALLVGSFFCTGLIPVASGTFGSLAALVVLLIPWFNDTLILSFLTAVFFFAGMYFSKELMRKYGDDPSVIVVDEVAGMWLTLIIFKAFFDPQPDITDVVICFLAFRFFDIIKLQPSKYFDKLKSPLGVMMDDIVAGIYAGITSVAVAKIANPIITKWLS